MRTKILATLFIGFFLFNTSDSKAQELGLRFGDVVSNDVAVDFIVSSGQFSRIHGDVSFGSGVGVDLLWDFIYKPLGTDGFDWYAGAGPTLWLHDPFWLGVSGEIGIEYHFAGAPVALGIDWRPTFFLIDDTDFRTEGFGFNARYVFGK